MTSTITFELWDKPSLEMYARQATARLAELGEFMAALRTQVSPYTPLRDAELLPLLTEIFAAYDGVCRSDIECHSAWEDDDGRWHNVLGRTEDDRTVIEPALAWLRRRGKIIDRPDHPSGTWVALK